MFALVTVYVHLKNKSVNFYKLKIVTIAKSVHLNRKVGGSSLGQQKYQNRKIDAEICGINAQRHRKMEYVEKHQYNVSKSQVSRFRSLSVSMIIQLKTK